MPATAPAIAGDAQTCPGLTTQPDTSFRVPLPPPVFTFGWAVFYQSQGLTEHLVVFWAAPLAAGLFGGWAFLGYQQWKAGGSGKGRGAQQRRAKGDSNGAASKAAATPAKASKAAATPAKAGKTPAKAAKAGTTPGKAKAGKAE